MGGQNFERKEAMTITIRDLIDREAIYCVSSLIGDLNILANNVSSKVLQQTSLDPDELLGLFGRDDWETPVYTYIDNMCRGELVEALEEADVEDAREPAVIAAALEEARQAPGSDVDSEVSFWHGVSDKDLKAKLFDHLKAEDELQEFATFHNIDPERDEVYEHWLITDWLADKLEARGEVVGRDICGLGAVWGRCTTGQSICMDGVIQQIYKDLTGQEADL